MTIRFRRSAEVDMREIIEWYEGVAPEALPHILDDIYASIDRLIDFPRLGARIPGLGLRRIISRRYHFKIAYEIGEDAIVIVGVFRFQDRQA